MCRYQWGKHTLSLLPFEEVIVSGEGEDDDDGVILEGVPVIDVVEDVILAKSVVTELSRLKKLVTPSLH
jgi:hypothetical protein